MNHNSLFPAANYLELNLPVIHLLVVRCLSFLYHANYLQYYETRLPIDILSLNILSEHLLFIKKFWTDYNDVPISNYAKVLWSNGSVLVLQIVNICILLRQVSSSYCNSEEFRRLSLLNISSLLSARYFGVIRELNLLTCYISCFICIHLSATNTFF